MFHPAACPAILPVRRHPLFTERMSTLPLLMYPQLQVFIPPIQFGVRFLTNIRAVRIQISVAAINKPRPFRLSCTDAASRCVSLSACFPHQLSYDPCTRNRFRCFSSTTVSPCPSAQASASSVPPPSRPQVTTRPLPAPPVLSLP